jgi:hypothetical protein
VAGACLVERLPQSGDFRLAPDKAREATRGGSLEAEAEGAGSEQLKDLHRRCHPLDRDWSQPLHPYQALH